MAEEESVILGTLTVSPVNSATALPSTVQERAQETYVPTDMLPFPEPCYLLAVCHWPLPSLPDFKAGWPTHVSPSNPLTKAHWGHCNLLCKTFMEAFTLLSSLFLPSALFLWFFSLGLLCLVSHFQFQYECWIFLACLLTLSRTVAYTHHLTHPLQAVLGKTGLCESWALGSCTDWRWLTGWQGSCPYETGKPELQRTTAH